MAYVYHSSGSRGCGCSGCARRRRCRRPRQCGCGWGDWGGCGDQDFRGDWFPFPGPPERPCRGVFYAGPCPPHPDCPWQPPLPPPPPDPPCYPPCPAPSAYAYFAQLGELTVEEPFCPIPFDEIDRRSAHFRICRGVITVLRPGTYTAAFHLALPESACACTRIALRLNGEVVRGSVLNIRKAEGEPETSASFEVTFTVYNAGERLEVTAAKPFTVDMGDPEATAASLTLRQVE